MDEIGLYDGADNLCWAVATNAGDYSFLAPANTTAVEIVFVGAGGGAGTADYGYGGNSGAVLFINDIEPGETIDIYVGAGGVNDGGYGEDGEDSTVTIGSTEYVAQGGDGGEYLVGQSGSGNDFGLAGDGWTQHGAGAMGDATPLIPGDGWAVNDPELVGADNPLWPAGDANIYGAGGRGDGDNDDNSGDGGDAYWDGNGFALESGQDGAIEIRYTIAAPDLASTGVDANSIGMTAGALGLGGVALAVVAAARRARRTK
jgi:hypothetical protein